MYECNVRREKRTHKEIVHWGLLIFFSIRTQHYYFTITKNRADGGDGDEMVHSEISCDGYVTAGEEVALSNYLVHPPSHNCVIVDIGV